MKTQQTSTSKQQQQTKPEESTNNDEQQTNKRTTTTLMELIRNKKKQQQENNKNKQKQNNKKTKPATGMKKPITENKSQPSADIRLYLANKKFEVEARAAAINQPDEPTQVRESNQPSQIVTSARSEPDAVPGDKIYKPNIMTQPRGEENERTSMIGCNKTIQ